MLSHLYRWLRIRCASAAALFTLGAASLHSADFVLVRGNTPYPAEERIMRQLADFYGIGLRVVEPGVSTEVNSSNAVAIIVPQERLRSFRRGWNIPVLVFGITPETSGRDLERWSVGAIHGCQSLDGSQRPKGLEIANVAAVTSELSGWTLPAVAAPVCGMQFEASRHIEKVLTAGQTAVMIRSANSDGDVFFVPKLDVFESSWSGRSSSLPQAFSSMAPFILFMKYAAGEHGWRLPRQFANFTIDDPWLVQPYGRLDYQQLLREAGQHDFHVTVGFVAWNFDRSKSDVIGLFRAEPQRLSIAIHGNNHTHREFGSYTDNPLHEQSADIRQAVARMERFRSSTGLNYDRFMVFPHAVAPEQTFAELKKYGFSGTANSLNVPLGSEFPADPLFLFRSYTLNYAGFLSMFRYSAETPVSPLHIALHSFLGNPLLFYGHESMFERGIDAFNDIADNVNRIRPDTRWASLGEIARHLYLLRKRDDGALDVEMLSSEADLTNAADEPKLFHVRRPENDPAAVETLTVDGVARPFDRSVNELSLTVAVPPGATRKVRIFYRNDLNVSRENTEKTELYVRFLRGASDFRDLYLSTSSAGRTVRNAYYRFGMNSVELYFERNWWIGAICLGLTIVYIRRRQRSKSVKKALAHASTRS
jgi:hypothetical protein